MILQDSAPLLDPVYSQPRLLQGPDKKGHLERRCAPSLQLLMLLLLDVQHTEEPGPHTRPCESHSTLFPKTPSATAVADVGFQEILPTADFGTRLGINEHYCCYIVEIVSKQSILSSILQAPPRTLSSQTREK